MLAGRVNSTRACAAPAQLSSSTTRESPSLPLLLILLCLRTYEQLLMVPGKLSFPIEGVGSGG
jgi:hypothetical protein